MIAVGFSLVPLGTLGILGHNPGLFAILSFARFFI